MGLWLSVVLVVAVFATSTLSGIFGMAGGMVLLAFLLAILPVSMAIAVQGAIQIIANGSRAWFSRAHIDWRILAIMTAGLLLAAALLFALRYVPDLATVCIVIGVLPTLLWIPQRWLALDASKPAHALICGFLAGAINLGVGVAGPTIDMFFIRTRLDRHTIIATKAAAQVVNHLAKVIFYLGASVAMGAGEWLVVALAAPFAIAGTKAGHWVLQRMSDANFKSWTRLLVTGIGIFYLARGILLLAG